MPAAKNTYVRSFLREQGKVKGGRLRNLISAGSYLHFTGQFFYITYIALLTAKGYTSFDLKLYTVTNFQTTGEQQSTRWQNRNAGNDHIWTGIFLLIVGGVALAKSLLVPIPGWLFSWQTFLITLGIFIGIRGNFHGAAWLILIIIGSAFLLNYFYPAIELRSRLWPLILICLGAVFILRTTGRKKNRQGSMQPDADDLVASGENFTDVSTYFGSAQKTITSKQFAGGDITCVFGSTELDLTNADIQGHVMLDVTTIFGGVELILPADWTIKSDAVSIFGAVKDNREQSTVTSQNPEKMLVLDGTVLFGGIEIKSFKNNNFTWSSRK